MTQSGLFPVLYSSDHIDWFRDGTLVQALLNQPDPPLRFIHGSGR